MQLNWIILFAAIVCETMATTALKASEHFHKFIPTAIVIIGYGFSFYFLSLALRTIPVGIAYAVWSGVGIILITIASWLLFNQKLDFPALIGITFIIGGILIMNLVSETSSIG